MRRPTCAGSPARPEKTSGKVGGAEPGHCRKQHDAFDAQVENPRPFRVKLTDGGEKQRRGDANHRREKTDLEDLREDFIHGQTSSSEVGSW